MNTRPPYPATPGRFRYDVDRQGSGAPRICCYPSGKHYVNVVSISPRAGTGAVRHERRIVARVATVADAIRVADLLNETACHDE